MVERRVTVANPLGVHARAAARFVQTAARYRASVRVSKDGQTIDGKSILGVLLLAATRGSELIISASGEDEDAAVEALVQLVARGFADHG